MFWGKIREENLNVVLAELLAESGLKAVGEVIVKVFGKRMPDVLLNINGVRIIIEGKRPGRREELYKKAYKRIDEGLCDVVMMVEYAKVKLPQILATQLDIKEALKSATYNVGFVTYVERIPKLGKPTKHEFYENVDFPDLVAHLMSAYEHVIKENFLDEVIEKLEKQIFSYAEKILASGINVNRLKQALELMEESKNEKG